ncbi:hypothetical protein [Neobacillus sp. FSL H8-0543]|uniref:hypothetical protein n=1 Tax=Neobacillus sp. FSL H8-0543 TaxID=2954672 RepID=UPI003158D742
MEDLVVVEAFIIAEDFTVAVLAVLAVSPALAVPTVGVGSFSKKFGYFMNSKCSCMSVTGALLFWFVIMDK